MTIDEAKKELQDVISTNETLKDDDFLNTLINSLNELKDIKNKYEAQTDIFAQMEQELNWWREQDLIKRDDMCQFFATSNCCEDVDCDRCEKYIPKAEPSMKIKSGLRCKDYRNVDRSEFHNQEPSADLIRCGDCETCKNITLKVDDVCIECLNGANHYEPYIPEENDND